MRKKIVAGNWKMFNNSDESKELIGGILEKLKNEKVNCDVIVCPPYTALSEAAGMLKGSIVKLGAQNMHFEDKGAFTGEISSNMLKSAGCEYVILGHSERRTIFNESDEVINKKVKKAFASGLKPIFCFGETLSEREGGVTNDVVKHQVTEGLKDIPESDLVNLVIAYEPVWAIGTGKTATPEQAEEVHAFVRSIIKELYSETAAENMVIQYGGSVKPENAADLLSRKNIDGALVGGACLKADSFIGIIKSA